MNQYRRMITLVLLLTIVLSMFSGVAYAKTKRDYTVEPGHNTKFSVRSGIFGNTLTVKNNGKSDVTVYVRKARGSWSTDKIAKAGKTISIKLSSGKTDYNVTMWLTQNYKGKKSKVTITF